MDPVPVRSTKDYPGCDSGDDGSDKGSNSNASEDISFATVVRVDRVEHVV